MDIKAAQYTGSNPTGIMSSWMTHRLLLSIGICCACALLSCADSDRADGNVVIVSAAAARDLAPCPRQLPDDRRPATSIILTRGADAPCQVVVTKIVDLKASQDGRYPDPSWTSVVRDVRGRFLAPASYERGVITVWDSAGSFIRTFGRQGAGPGELLGDGLPLLLASANDSLYILEGSRVSVFGSDFEFARVFRARGAASSMRETIHVTNDGSLIFTGRLIGGPSGATIHIANASGETTRSFGSLADGEAMPRMPGSYDPNGSVWLAHFASVPGAYVVEQWGLDGRRMRRVERRAEWLHPPEELADGPPYIESIHIDHQGLLWVLLYVADERWRPERPGDDEDAIGTLIYDVRWDVIDSETGVLLASGVADTVPGEDERGASPLSMFIPGTSLSYRPFPDSLGRETVEIFAIRLVSRHQIFFSGGIPDTMRHE